MSRGEVQLLAMSGLPALDARRGLVRIHPSVMTALAVAPWDVVFVTGQRRTAVLAAKSPQHGDPRIAWCDDLTLQNAAAQQTVSVQRAPMAVCRELTLFGPTYVMENVDPELVRTALLGKPMTVGDEISLLPQDYRTPVPINDQAHAAQRHALHSQVGQGWQQITFTVRGCDPSTAGIVAPNTRIRWQVSANMAVQQPGSARELVKAGLTPITVSGRDATDLAAETMPAPRWPVQPPRDPFHRGVADGELVLPEPVAPTSRSATPPAGLGEPTRQLVEWLDIDFHQRELLARLGSSNQLGVLLTAPSGSGCGEIIAAACAAVGAEKVRLWATEVAAAADPAQVLNRALSQARERPPAVLVIDDIESLLPNSDGGETGPLHATTLRLIEEAVGDEQVAVICTSRNPSRVHPDIRSEGRLDRELVVQPPDAAARAEMLAALTVSTPMDNIDLTDLAERTTGFVLADLRSLVRESVTRAAFRLRESSPGGSNAQLVVTGADIQQALDVVRPSTAEGRAMPVPDLTLDDIGGLEDVKRILTEVVLWPLQHPETFARLGVAAPAGLLLHGPPGCGKTHVVRALAGSGRLTVFSVKGAELLSKWVGESERGVRELFRTARAAAPALVFLDEVDALAPVRGDGGSDAGTTERVVAALLTELDGIDGRSGVVVVAATNRIDRIDPAVLRPGRLERHVEVPPPDAAARADVLRACAVDSPLADDVDLAAIAAACEGFSAADCAALVREAALATMRESMELTSIAARHFELARSVVRPSLRGAQ